MDINYEKPSAELLHLRKVLLSSQYYIYSNLPSPLTYRPNNQFFGLSPGGLSTGKLFESYQRPATVDLVSTWMSDPSNGKLECLCPVNKLKQGVKSKDPYYLRPLSWLSCSVRVL